MGSIMETAIVIGTTLSIGIIRVIIANRQKGKKSKKIRYYNYRQYEIKYKKLNDSINQQSKNNFSR